MEAYGVCVFLCVSSGGGIVHVGVMLWAAERGDGHGHGAGSAAGVRSRGGALPLRPQCWVLHLPPHQLRERRTAVQGLRTGLLRLQTQGEPEPLQVAMSVVLKTGSTMKMCWWSEAKGEVDLNMDVRSIF